MMFLRLSLTSVINMLTVVYSALLPNFVILASIAMNKDPNFTKFYQENGVQMMHALQ